MTSLPIETLRALMVVLLALPAAGAVAAALLGARRLQALRWLSLIVTVADLAVAVLLAVGFTEIRANSTEIDPAGSVATFRPEIVPGATDDDPHRTTWNLVPIGTKSAMQFYIGLDGISVWLVLLTAFLMVPAVLISWTIEERANEYFAWLLALGTAMLGVFLSFDILLFYVFFELTLVPLFFLIGIWGGPERRTAARKFFIYTLAGSLITLLGVLAVVVVCYDREHELTFSVPDLVRTVNTQRRQLARGADEGRKAVQKSEEAVKAAPEAERPDRERTLEVAKGRLQDVENQWQFWQNVQFWVFLALIVGFAIKVPLFPMHTWLPLAHTEAPTAGSVLLAGVLLKVGAYGFLRLALPLAPDAAASVGVPLVGTLAVVGILYGAFCALAQDDIKKLVAYSSVSHLGFCMLGMFALNEVGLAGSLLQMINHGLSTGGLFLLVGMLYDRYHTRRMSDYGGMGAHLGLLSACMVFISLSSIGLPGLNGFVGEALVFLGIYQAEPALAVVGTAGIVLGAWYLLTMVMRVFFGPEKVPPHEGHGPVGDLNLREWFAIGPIMVLCVVLGVYPQPVLDSARRDLKVIADIVERNPRSASQAQGPRPVGAAAAAQEARR